MYGEQGNGSKTPPWLVRAEVTIRHGTPVTESGQPSGGVSSTSVTDSSGVRMVYRWNTAGGGEPGQGRVPAGTSTAVPGSFGFQRGNILFTSTPPPRPQPGSFTIPRSGSSGNDDSTSSRGRANVSDSGYNSERFSPQSYSSLPSRRPSQQYNRRCKSTCSIVLSSACVENAPEKEKTGNLPAGTHLGRHPQEDAVRHRPAHQHIFPRYQFSTVPEVCEDCLDGGTSSAFTTHFCTRLREKLEKDEAVAAAASTSKDAASQTTDIESRGSSSTVATAGKVRRKATGPRQTAERRKTKVTRHRSRILGTAGETNGLELARTPVEGKDSVLFQPENQSPSTPPGSTSSALPLDSEKSDSSAREDSSKRKSRTVHIDVYCTGSDDDATSGSSTENECDTPITVFENPDVRVTHTQATDDSLPRGFQDEKAFLKRATERRCESFKHAPMRMPSLASSKGYDSDDLLSSLYPSQFSSYTALQGIDSAPWSAASSNAAMPFDYDSTIATSAKDTFSDIESVLNNRTDLTPCDSFEYANTSDRDRIRRMEEIWARGERPGSKTWRSPHIERKQLLQSRRVREYLESRSIGWSSEDSDSDESCAVGWSFLPSEDGRLLKKTSTVRRASKAAHESVSKPASAVMPEAEVGQRSYADDPSDTGSRRDSVLHPYATRDHIGPFGSKSPSPLPSKVPSRVTSPFTTPQGERTDHIVKASRFGPVISAFRKPGHHIGPSKNPSCSCEHCRRYFEEMAARGWVRSVGEFEKPLPRLGKDREIVYSGSARSGGL